jgi:amino acid adenylation domain-containing protein
MHLALADAPPLHFADEEVERSLPERFARVAAARPSALAVAVGDNRITYGELAQRVDRLAVEIAHRRSGSDAPVAVFLRDHVSMITAILATWKAGGICVPLDASQPQARLEVILRDSLARLVVTDRESSASLARSDVGISQLQVDNLEVSERAGLVRSMPGADAPACILYTSGSTGLPKGVLRSHRSILHRARCSVISFAMEAQDRMSVLHSPATAAGLRDLVAALLGGIALFPFDIRRAGFGEFARWIDREQISILCTVVSSLRQMLANLDRGIRFRSLRIVRVGSEPLYSSDVERLREHVRPDCVLIAGYGATEASGIVEYRMDGATSLPTGRIPAGYPLGDVDIIIRDEEGRPVKRGEAGEVYVRSRYLSLGYWRQPELTRSVFEGDPSDAQMRTYRTGDVGRLRDDRCLELLGRRDEQVKVRGYRVQPGEIEFALAAHEEIREASVMSAVDASGETRLVAYFVPQSWPAPTATQLRRYLASRLPAYMVPGTYVAMGALPLTASGKVDRQALPPTDPKAIRERDFVAPRSPTEHQMAEIWERVFGVSPIGANDNFFDLGGDSLKAAALVSAIEGIFERVLAPSVLLTAPTVGDLTAAIIRVDSGFDESITALRAAGARAPIFFLHNDYGRGLYTHAIARSLGPGHPFYAVHRDRIDGMGDSPTVELLAGNCVRSLRAVRPHGPYVVGGHCHGGLIALDVARQLRAAGEVVELVVLVDTRAPTPARRSLRQVSRSLGPPGEAVFDGVDSGLKLAVRAGEEIAWRAVYYRKRLATLRQKGGLAETPQGAPREPLAVRHAYSRAARRYLPERYTGRVALFRAEEFPARHPDLGWSKLLPQLEIVVVPGDHYTCITRHVAEFAARLDDVLRRADGALAG